jgi:hypothetical protein
MDHIGFYCPPAVAGRKKAQRGETVLIKSRMKTRKSRLDEEGQVEMAAIVMK